ncbi:MAG: hypothetical protein QOI35_3022, partial [Cryptosporangiaceae bacterium]|nr:hypothetical protein [Cryptosporangiaceae bacterium]
MRIFPAGRLRGVVAACAVTASALGAIPALSAPASAAGTVPLVTNPAQYVDPFIGASRGGNTWPGATRPFGMIAWSPTSTTGDQTSTGAANGYEYGVT